MSIPLEIAVGMHFHAQIWHWWHKDASWSLLPSSVSLLSGGTVQPENTYSCILKVIGQVLQSQKDKHKHLITATTSIHLPKPVSTDLTIKPDSLLTNPIARNRWGAKLVNVKHLPLEAFLLWHHDEKGSSPHEVRLALLGTKPVKEIPKRFSKKFSRFFPRDSHEIFKEIPRKELIIHHSHIQIALETSNGFFVSWHLFYCSLML